MLKMTVGVILVFISIISVGFYIVNPIHPVWAGSLGGFSLLFGIVFVANLHPDDH